MSSKIMVKTAVNKAGDIFVGMPKDFMDKVKAAENKWRQGAPAKVSSGNDFHMRNRSASKDNKKTIFKY